MTIIINYILSKDDLLMTLLSLQSGTLIIFHVTKTTVSRPKLWVYVVFDVFKPVQ